MTQVGSLSSDSGMLKKVIFITCSIFSLLMINYFGNFIKTELVTIQPPEIFSSYQDLIDNKVVVTFAKGMSDYLHFKFAQNGSPKEKLWDLSVADLGEEKIVLAITPDNDEWISMFRRLQSRKAVLVFDSSIMPVCFSVVCKVYIYNNLKDKWAGVVRALVDHPGDLDLSLLPIVLSDENEKPSVKGLIYSSHFKGTSYQRLRRFFKMYYEGGFIMERLRQVHAIDPFGNAGFPAKPQGNEFNESIQCAQGVIKTPELDLTGIKLSNMVNFWILIMSLYSLAFCVILWEIFKFHFGFPVM